MCAETKKPTKAQCRVTGSSDYFTYESSSLAPDILYRPCTTFGVICRNQDQNGHQCHDYQIRFYCPQYKDDLHSDTVANFWMIALVGAGCIIAPLLCVVILQCYREVRVRRNGRGRAHNRRREIEGSVSTTETDIENAQPPPSYQALFGNDNAGFSNQSNENLINSERTSGIRSSLSRLFGLSSTPVTSHSDANEHTDSSDIPHISQGNLFSSEQSQSRDLSSERAGVHSNSSRRYPGMHISIFDSFSSPCEDVVTPPPSYKDAIVIIGKCPPTYSESVVNKQDNLLTPLQS